MAAHHNLIENERWLVWNPKPDWRSSSLYLKEQSAKDPGKVLVISSTEALELEYYNDDVCIPGLLQRDFHQYKSVYFILNRSWLADGPKDLAALEANPSLAIAEKQNFKMLEVYRFERSVGGTSQFIRRG